MAFVFLVVDLCVHERPDLVRFDLPVDERPEVVDEKLDPVLVFHERWVF